MKFSKTLLSLALLGTLSCNENASIDPEGATITSIACSNATFSVPATSGASYTATASVPYTGGNGGDYTSDDAVASSGVLGLTATLQAGTLAEGSGTANFIITGTPTTSGTASFAIALGGQTCTLALPVAVSKSSISSLVCVATPANGTSGTAYTGTLTMNYTGGNGGVYDVSTASSIGVEGLTATVAAGTLSNGAGSLVYNISGTPSSAGNAIFNLSLGGQSCTVSLIVAATASGTATPAKDTVVINYSGVSAAISNPYQSDGVSITLSGADVTVKSTNVSKEIVYLLSGNATKGSFKLYSEYRYNITMKGVNITNSIGPAVNIQSTKKGTINVLAGTTNNLVDGVTYSTSTEDQKGTFFSEGQLNFMGTGTLNVTGNNKHGIVADDYIAISEAKIIIKSAIKDGIHANDYFLMDNGNLSLTSSGDGIVAEEGYVAINGGTININSVDDGISAPYEGTDASITPYVLIKGGKITVNTSGEKGNALKSQSYTTIITIDAINLNVSGKGAKGIKTGGDFTLNAGTVKITNSGVAYYNTTDADIVAPAGINCDKNLKINGGDVSITCTGQGGKGINVDGTATLGGGATNITASGAKFTYSSTQTSEAKGFKSDGAFVMNNGELNISATDDGLKSGTSVTVNNGTINVTKSYEGMESIFININGGVTNLTASNDGINTSYGTVSGGTESNDGSSLTIGGGVLIVTGSDGVDVNGNFFIKGGTTIVSGNEGIDINGNFIISGGTIISSGPNSNMTKSMSTSSTQVSMFIKSTSSLAATSLIHIEDASGKDLVTCKPRSAAAIFHFSSPSLAKNTSYKIYYGGTYTGGSFVGNSSGWGLYTGGSYSNTGATLKSSPTTSSSAAVNALTF
ncbi:carbohydrate-binding domain-containing protein [Lacihabitans soyangensis]|uniref:Carbohydrate-binding domain-containing protein n=1 Tax=Lacihabitans soyangensis TaxID=869394 RepID=A0AAE3KY05_9BACT|nr:carbohydrate-binding domain-containing protein [Lacihabitans soyangensis]MCP9766255.1 carbohydrate-binding domain-containing protein [Lacihabitans soyangensis]